MPYREIRLDPGFEATNVQNYSNVDIIDAYTKHYDIEIQDFKVRDRGGAHPTLEEKRG